MLTMSSDSRKGLVGVVVDETAISHVTGDPISLTYRSYEIEDLVENCTAEEVAYLILCGDLPNPEELAAFQKKARGYREISENLIALIRQFPDTAHPMARLRTAVSYLGLEDPQAEDNTPEVNLEKAVRLMARMPTIIATDYRYRKGLERIPPRPDLSFGENFFHMCFGEIPEQEILRCFDICLILYAELSFTPSTFTSRVVVSSLSDMYSAVTAAIGSLKGPLHGGANTEVMRMLFEIDEPKNAQAWLDKALANRKTVIGFGHRIFRRGDARGHTMYNTLLKLVDLKNGERWLNIQKILAKTMLERKGLYPNVDYLAAPAYYLMGFDIELFTPIFAMSRITGWSAHIMEQLATNKLIRPISVYVGPPHRKVEK